MTASSRPSLAIAVLVTSSLLLLAAPGCEDPDPPMAPGSGEATMDGREIFRFDTFGDEQLWTDQLALHEVIETLSPATALGLGLKVDGDAVPPDVLAGADLEDPATTLALIGLDAVVGVVGTVRDGRLERVGITCALCHSDVDDSVGEGIGRRLDGWPNLDLDVGAIIATSPAMQDPEVQDALRSWGPGKYDARYNQDGLVDAAVIPPAYGLAGTELASFTGDGDISYWNAYVAVTQMGGHGVFQDPRIDVDVVQIPDLVTSKLPALRAYQHSLRTPPPPAGSFDPAMAKRGHVLFAGKAGCASCHAGPSFSDDALHPAGLTGTDPRHAERSATGRYRTTPLRGLWQHPPYFHDGSAATLEEVVDHYDAVFELGLTPVEKAELVEFLASI